VRKRVGASCGGGMGLFSGVAFVVGLLGSVAGIAGGWLFLARINRIEEWLYQRFGFQLWDRTIYAIGEIPHEVRVHTLAVIALFAIVACLIGALVPAYSAARLRPVETLHGGRT
jgi:lipoprotein-releasing system permease protein